jgi:CheY-like chemotaxis protein
VARILLIDDDDLLRGVLAQALIHGGHTVVEASNGQEGLDLFRAAPVELVITDLIMPVQEGVETIMKLRRLKAAVPIIAISGGVSNSKHYLDLAAKIGAKRILAKPFTPLQLIEAVDEVLAEAAS